MGWAEKGLIKKLLTGSLLAGTLFFNSATAQENYVSKYNTTTHYILKEIQKENAFTSPKTLDNIIDQSKKIITKKNYTEEEAQDLMKKINSEIIEKYPELKKNNQSCYYKSLTYLAIGEINKLPLHTVTVPEHMFVRWDPDGKHQYLDTNPEQTAMFALFTGKLPKTFSKEERIEAEKLNKEDFNWDVNSLEFNTDQDYFMNYPFPQEDIDKKWLKNLNKKELLAQSYRQEAIVLGNAKKHKKALEYINKSLELDTLQWGTYALKGDFLSKIGEECIKSEKNISQKSEQLFLESNKYYEKAIKMTNSKDFSSLGKNFYFLGDYQKSEECFNKTLEVFKNEPDMFLKRAKFYYSIGQEEKAIDDLLIAYNIKGKKIIKSKDKFIQIKFVEDIIDFYKNKSKEKIYFKNVAGKNILERNEAKKACDIPNEYLRRWGFKDFWRLPSLEEMDNIYETYKEIKVPEYKIWSNEEKKSPNKGWYWSSDGDDKESFIKSFKNGSVKKINKNPHYWKLEEIEIYNNISCMCVIDLDENETNKLLNDLEKISWY